MSVIPQGATPEDILAVARRRYLEDPTFHTCVEQLVRERLGEDPSMSPTTRAVTALHVLRDAMADMPQPGPQYVPGTEPSAADVCRDTLDLMDHCLRQLATFIGTPS